MPTGGDGWYVMSGGVVGGAALTNDAPRSGWTAPHESQTQNLNAAAGSCQNHVFALHYLAAGQYVEVLGMSANTLSSANVNGHFAHIAMIRVGKDDRPGACVTRTSTQSVAVNANDAIVFNSAVRDNWGMSDIGGSNPSRLTVPAGQGGWYIATGNMRWTAATTGYRCAALRVNGNAQWEARHTQVCNTTSTDDPGLPVGQVMYLNAGDYIELYAANTAGAGANTTQADEVFLSLVKVDN